METLLLIDNRQSKRVCRIEYLKSGLTWTLCEMSKMSKPSGREIVNLSLSTKNIPNDGSTYLSTHDYSTISLLSDENDLFTIIQP